MKNTVLFLFIGFWVVTLGALSLGKLNSSSTPNTKIQTVNNATGQDYTPPTNSTTTDNTASTSTTPPEGPKTYTLAQVAQHKSSSSCWVVIGGSAYDVTSYLQMHPGGARAISQYCGGDATTAFATMGGRGQHSSYAYSLLKDYLLGKISG